MNELDYIVVGQGIAGSCLSYELMRRGKKVVIFDESWRDAACLVAAGVINPITGKRLVKSWRSEIAHSWAKDFYSKLESELGADFYHPRKILQLCKSDEECALWRERSLQQGYAEFIQANMPPASFESLNDANGSYVIGRSAWVESSRAMEAFKKFFLSKKVLIDSAFDFSKLNLSREFLEYEGLSSRKIIFADGWRVLKNPFFSWLPYRPAKGEILTFKSSTILPDHVIHRGNWIMKCAENIFRMGSTWEREVLNSIPTQAAKTELSAALKNILPNAFDAQVIDHSAGVRPCTATTRPHLGAHPKDSRILSFNGFGSKGYALSPYFAHHFSDWLDGLVPLDSEADLSRHIKKFFR